MIVKCPNCGEEFDLTENDAAEIIKQVRTTEFNEEIERYKKELSEKAALEAKAEIERKEAYIQSLNGKLERAKADKEIAVTTAVSEKDIEIAKLQAELAKSETDTKIAVTEALNSAKASYEETIAKKDAELEDRQKEVDYYKNLKLTMSTKAIGESLELHCQNDYNMHLRSLLPNAYFEKDNEISESGSKGDYIFREEIDGIPLLSIMFEMKNDSLATENRHKNEFFFKELDKDRKEKGCEYAVLVSMLESENEYYNQGIVDVSYKYPKMFVIRPQFLVPLITLLRNAALNAYSYKSELENIKAQNIDVTNFEADLEYFKTAFSRSCELTGKSFATAIAQIDKAIKDMEGVKEALIASGKHLIAADNKLEDLSIKKLTRKNPTMKEKFEEARTRNN